MGLLDKTSVESNLAKRPHRRLVTPRGGEWICLPCALHRHIHPT